MTDTEKMIADQAEAPEEPQAVGAELFEEAADPAATAPPGTVLVLPGPKPVYLNKQGALAWFDREIERSRRKVQDPDYGENFGAMARMTYLQEERAKIANAKTPPKPRSVTELAHPAVQ